MSQNDTDVASEISVVLGTQCSQTTVGVRDSKIVWLTRTPAVSSCGSSRIKTIKLHTHKAIATQGLLRNQFYDILFHSSTHMQIATIQPLFKQALITQFCRWSSWCKLLFVNGCYSWRQLGNLAKRPLGEPRSFSIHPITDCRSLVCLY